MIIEDGMTPETIDIKFGDNWLLGIGILGSHLSEYYEQAKRYSNTEILAAFEKPFSIDVKFFENQILIETHIAGKRHGLMYRRS